MKKIIYIVIAFVLAFGYSGCSIAGREEFKEGYSEVYEGAAELEEEAEPTQKPTPIKTISASELYKLVDTDEIDDYMYTYLIVTGTVVSISDFDGFKGYYLHGEIGSGVVCWVDEKESVAQIDDEVSFLGFVDYLGIEHIELTRCELYNR